MLILVKFVRYLGNFGFDKIGTPDPEGIPLFALRFVPALCGSALTPTIYLILCELGLSPFAGGLAGILFLFGKLHFSITHNVT